MSVRQLCKSHVPIMFGVMAARELEASDLSSKFREEALEVRDIEGTDTRDAPPE